MILEFISWMIVGGVAGWIASKIMKTDKEMGIGANIVVGVIGAVIGGFTIGLLGYRTQDGTFNLSTLLTAVLGAVILLAILKAIRR